MGAYERAYIYFDTNSLECRHSGKSLYLSQFTVNPLYYEIEDLIRNMGLTGNVEICIPDIVWLELQEHLISHYKSEKCSMKTKIDAFRKSFGNLAEIVCEFKDCNTNAEYSRYVSDIAQDFLSNPRVNAKIIPCPKDEDAAQRIIQKAIHSERPFRTAKAGGKEYTDAGLKDALIFDTIITHTGDQLGILISNDNDFSELFNNASAKNLIRCSSTKEVQGILLQTFSIASIDMIETILNTDEYLMERILSECEIEQHACVSNLKIISCENVEDNTNVKFVAIVNGTKCSFEITYNMNANELIDASFEFLDEEDE